MKQSESAAREQWMRIYAASRASVPERPAMWQRLRSEGHNIISSWIDEAMPGATADLSELWARIVREVTTADRLVLYVEPDDFPLKGALLEVGFAIASGKRVYVVAPGCKFTAPSYRPIGSWIRHPLVTVCAMDAALAPFAAKGETESGKRVAAQGEQHETDNHD